MFVKDFQKWQENTDSESPSNSLQGFDTRQGVSHDPQQRSHKPTTPSGHTGLSVHSQVSMWFTLSKPSMEQSDLGYFKFIEHMPFNFHTSVWEMLQLHSINSILSPATELNLISSERSISNAYSASTSFKSLWKLCISWGKHQCFPQQHQ